MKRQPVAVTPTVTPVANVAATSAQTRFPSANRRSPTRRRSNGGWFPAYRDRAAQPGLRVIPTANKAMPPEAAVADAPASMRAGLRATAETARPRPTSHRDTSTRRAGKGKR